MGRKAEPLLCGMLAVLGCLSKCINGVCCNCSPCCNTIHTIPAYGPTLHLCNGRVSHAVPAILLQQTACDLVGALVFTNLQPWWISSKRRQAGSGLSWSRRQVERSLVSHSLVRRGGAGLSHLLSQDVDALVPRHLLINSRV
jgi:hypothetical protein